MHGHDAPAQPGHLLADARESAALPARGVNMPGMGASTRPLAVSHGNRPTALALFFPVPVAAGGIRRLGFAPVRAARWPAASRDCPGAILMVR
jgi:hypothetical protein